MTLQFNCTRCSHHQPVEIEPIESDDWTPFAWGNIKCGVCGFIIATMSAEVRGRLVFVTEEQAAGIIAIAPILDAAARLAAKEDGEK